jgi:hypothetical protein
MFNEKKDYNRKFGEGNCNALILIHFSERANNLQPEKAMQIRCVEEEITTSVDYQAGKSPMKLTFDNLPTTSQSQTHVKQVIKPGVLNKRKRSSETDKLETAILQSLQPQGESALLGSFLMGRTFLSRKCSENYNFCRKNGKFRTFLVKKIP